MKHRFSIIIPVFNVERYIKDCIDSVLRQTYNDFELILIDDGSSDASGEICDFYQSKCETVKVFHIDNHGPVFARQFGIERATGDYIVSLDSDDWLDCNALETINRIIEKDKSDCVVFGYKRVLSGRVLFTTKKEEPVCLSDKKVIYMKCFTDSSYNSLCRKAFKASILERKDYSSFYHIPYGEDLLQSIIIYKNAKSISFIDDKIYNYRVNPNSVTQTKDYSIKNPSFVIRQEVLNFLISEKVFDENDFAKYKTFCSKLIFDEIISISSSNASIKRKREIFNQIVGDEYFLNFILNDKYIVHKNRIYNLLKQFSRKHYSYFLTRGVLNRFARKIKIWFKRRQTSLYLLLTIF